MLAIAATAILATMVWGRSRATIAATVIAAGLAFGPIFPTIIAILLDHFPKEVHGRAVGLLFAIGGIGWTTVPMLIGAYARRTSVQRSFLIAAGWAVGLCVVAVTLLGVVSK